MPEPIFSKDLDTLNSFIVYSLVAGDPTDYKEYFEIDKTTGVVKQIKAIERKNIRHVTMTIKVIFVKYKISC